MEHGKLDRDSISQPELWQLTLMISDSALDVALYPPVASEEMIWRTFYFDPAAPDPLKALEDTIYGNPLLLDDFKRVDCLTDNGWRLPIPVEATADEGRMMLEATFPELPADSETEFYATGTSNATMASVQSPQIKSFLRRTFYNIRFTDRMSQLCRYFSSCIDGSKPKRVYALCRDKHLVVLAFDGSRLLMANEFGYHKPIDASYYIVASMRQLGLDPSETDVAVTGDEQQELISVLRSCVPQAGTIHVPTLPYRASKETLLAPFDLIIRPLCE